MTADLDPYPVMKDSGVEWLKEVPAHWEILPNRAVFSEVKQQGYADELMLSVTISRGVIPQDELLEGTSKKDQSRIDKSAYKLIQPGDISYNKMRAWQGAIGVSGHRGIISPAYVVQRPLGSISATYMHYLFRTPIFTKEAERFSYGITSDMWSLRPEDFKIIYVCIPSPSEQTAIARFLDHATDCIDRYVCAKEKLVALLEEQKQAIVRDAVTGRTDVRTGKPYPAYKPSGFEWLGMVPAHWEVRRLKTLSNMQSGDAITAMSIEESGEYPVYGGNGVRGFALNYTHDGNFALIGRQGALCGNVHLANGRFWASEHAVVATLQRGHVLGWFSALLGAMNLNQYSIAAAQPGLSVDRVVNLWAPVPPQAEQTAIARFLDKSSSKINDSIVRVQRQIDFLNEYRTCLISDVVTGKLDVREAAAKLLQETSGSASIERTNDQISSEKPDCDAERAVRGEFS